MHGGHIILKKKIRCIKPGSHTCMPPKNLGHSHWCCLRYCCGMWGHNATGKKKHHRSLPLACLRCWTWVNFTGMSVVKTDTPSVADNFCSHIGTVLQAVPAAMSQVAQRNIRTSLYKNMVVVHICYFHTLRCHVFAERLMWYFSGVYIINLPCYQKAQHDLQNM